jgi:predicted NAD/FAD-binding protein
MLGDPTEAERSVLSALPYQENEAILHTDSSVMPTRRSAWAAWNYHVLKTDSARVPVTYSMNILQGLPTQTQYMVTLNRSEAIDSSKVIRRLRYHHPQYTLKGMQARTRWNTISGVNRTHYCGAYWFNGFHEDGVNSALRVCEHFGEAL